jgi:hypothetical protein
VWVRLPPSPSLRDRRNAASGAGLRKPTHFLAQYPAEARVGPSRHAVFLLAVPVAVPVARRVAISMTAASLDVGIPGSGAANPGKEGLTSGAAPTLAPESRPNPAVGRRRPCVCRQRPAAQSRPSFAATCKVGVEACRVLQQAPRHQVVVDQAGRRHDRALAGAPARSCRKGWVIDFVRSPVDLRAGLVYGYPRVPLLAEDLRRG